MTLRGLDWRAIRGSFHNETKTHPYLPFNERPWTRQLLTRIAVSCGG